MKTFKNLVIGGIENKVINLILITIIVLTLAFWGVGEYQNRMLEEVSTTGGDHERRHGRRRGHEHGADRGTECDADR